MNPLDHFYNAYELAIATQVRMEIEHAKRSRLEESQLSKPRIDTRRNNKNVGNETEAAA